MRASALMGVLWLSACAQLPAMDYPERTAEPEGQATYLDRASSALEASHPGSSGFLMLHEGRSAFAARAHVTARAERSIDVQTYIWRPDLTGKYLAYEILQAADRGVHVRMLLDDLDARAKNDPLAALDSHPNIEVRLFNPMASRRGVLRAAGEFLRSFRRLNHRMHVKNWIADNRVAIAGGRNVGDEYFAASDATNFADLDLMMVGKVVRDGSREFDRYWNSGAVYAIADLDPALAARADLGALRTEFDAVVQEITLSRYANELRDDAKLRDMAAGKLDMYWDAGAILVADDPLKAQAADTLDKSNVLRTLLPRMQAANAAVFVISPYFVPGKSGTQMLIELAGRGIAVRVLTNSLAANDVAAVHGGYSKYRKQLLAGGVQIWELKPYGTAPLDSTLLGSSGASLHAKAVVVDAQELFVGSYNFDSRSTALNAEMGIYVHSTELAGSVNAMLEQGMQSGITAWRVTLVDGDLQWSDSAVTLDHEPDASWWRRFQAWLTRHLPVEPLL
jgi:putative cardiolipin synthase